MLKKCSCAILLVPIVLLLQVILLGFDLVLLTAGSGSIDNDNNNLPKLSDYYLVRIEADQFSTTVGTSGNETAPYKGLPDSHDFSKQKDWFAIYASLYCSGHKNGTDQYAADYCSPWPGKQLFDLQWLWRVWGVDLVADNYIGVFPQTIFASLMTSITASALTIVLGVFSFCSYWFLVLAVVLSLISVISTITFAPSSQRFVTRLTSSSIPISNPSGSTGKIVVIAGEHHVRDAWIATGVALTAALLWVFIFLRDRQRAAATRAHGGTTISGRSFRRGARDNDNKKNTIYRNLDGVGDGDREAEKAASAGEQTELMSRSISPGPGPAPGMPPQFESGQPTIGGGIAYEPMRHRQV